MEEAKTFQEIVFGDMSMGVFFGYLAVMFIGWAAVTVWEIAFRDPASTNTPKEFSLLFWIKDNYGKLIAFVLVMSVLILFFEELTDSALTRKLAIGIGLTLHATIVNMFDKIKRKKKTPMQL